ncbi:MAG TPA: ABC transporter ATP-binding protein [Phycisphaerae bacterium]|nr:ABC transporter ATP-binding protein [Phycisphaerae bacterium]
MSDTRRLEPVVQCIALSKVFQDFWGRDRVLAVDKLDLEISPGEIFGLLGPNGSGKTTTIKMLLGLLYPTSGAARIFGRPPTDTMIKSRIGFMPEESYLYRYLNAYETLDYYGRLFKLDGHERRRRTEQLIEMVGLKRAAGRAVGTYSKGMARRIGLAQALINDPDLLILDEPTTGLDPVGTRQIKDVIKTLGRRGKTVILCSHLLADVEDVCDRVAIMYGGRCQALGTVRELLQRQDITQITTRLLDPALIGRIRQIVAESGSEVLSVDHPTDRLEALFLRVVGQAQRERLQTSGAESTLGVSQFLTGSGGEGEDASLVESLVKAGKEPVTDREGARRGSEEPVEAAVPLRTDLIAALAAEKPTSPPGPPGDKTKPSMDEPIEAPIPQERPDESVLKRLVKPDDE